MNPQQSRLIRQILVPLVSIVIFLILFIYNFIYLLVI